MKPEKTFSLKDDLFNRDSVTILARSLGKAWSSFPTETFIEETTALFPHLELKERITCLSDHMAKHLPDSVPAALEILVAALPAPLDPTKTDDDFGDFIWAPHGHFIATHACTKELLPQAFTALYEVTKRFSAEFALRSFLIHFPEETLEQLHAWAQDDNYHVRRLVSEGTRPRLPWAMGIPNITPADTLPLLEQLVGDPTRYVSRSVANHVNDWNKTHPDLALKTVRRWQANQAYISEAEVLWAVPHSLRTLIKQGNSEALALAGFASDAPVDVVAWVLDQENVSLGEALTFSVELQSRAACAILVDYVLEAPTPSGKTRTKVFSLAKKQVTAGQTLQLKKRHPIRPLRTRTVVVGPRTLTLRINGTSVATRRFTVIAS